MYEETQTTSRKVIIVLSLLIAVTALGIFTGLSFGLLKKSDAAVVKDTASSPDFKDANDFIVTTDENLVDTDATLAERISSNSGKVICAIDKDKYGLISAVAGVRSDKVLVNGRYVRFLVVPDNVNNQIISNILGTEAANNARCKNVQDGKFFFFEVTPTISYFITPGAGSHESLVA